MVLNKIYDWDYMGDFPDEEEGMETDRDTFIKELVKYFSGNFAKK
jgi:hypothetical protein